MRLYFFLACFTLLNLTSAIPSKHLLPRRHADSHPAPAAARTRGRAIHPNADWEGYALQPENPVIQRRVIDKKAEKAVRGVESAKVGGGEGVGDMAKLGRFTMGRRKGGAAVHVKGERRAALR